MSAQLEEDLLRYKISAESHNTVLLGLYLKMGLYPISDYDFDMITHSDFNLIVYYEYSLYHFFSKTLDDDYNSDSDLDFFFYKFV